MGIANRLRAEFRDLTERAWESGMIWGDLRTWAGPQVTANTALTSAAVFACVRILTESISSLPLLTYRHLDPRGKALAKDHWLYETLNHAPNPEMTTSEWLEASVGHLVLRGNAYMNLVPTKDGGYQIWPLRPDRMVVRRVPANEATPREPVDSLQYLYTLPSGEQRRLRPGVDLMHVRSFSPDGILGYAPVTMARQALGLELGLEEYGARVFSNGARAGGVLKSDKRLSKEALGRLRADWSEYHQGLENAHRVAILEEGVSYQQIGMSNEDAQWLESRNFSLLQMARIFHVPAHMLAIPGLKETGNSLEQKAQEYVQYTLMPICVRFERRIWMDLLRPDQRHFVEFNLDGLLRGVMQERYESYAIGRQWGILSADDVRDKENMNPIPPGEPATPGAAYWQPVNMEALGTTHPKSAQKAPPKSSGPEEEPEED